MANYSAISLQSVSPALLSDRDLLDATARVAGDERRATTELLALLAELDIRKLYLGEGYSSLFTYCTQRLHLSESAAYRRITAARAARRFPILLARLAEGDVTLTSISLLAAHLTDDSHESLIGAVRHASRRNVERLVAGLHTQPDIPASVRRMSNGAGPREGATPVANCRKATQVALLSGSDVPAATVASAVPPASAPTRTAPRPAVASLAIDRYLLRVTISASTHAKLDRARDLLRHSVPNGDPAAIIDRALTVLIDQLERRKTGRVTRSSGARPGGNRPRGRHVPAAGQGDDGAGVGEGDRRAAAGLGPNRVGFRGTAPP